MKTPILNHTNTGLGERKRRATRYSALCAHCGDFVRIYYGMIACPKCDWEVETSPAQTRQLDAARYSHRPLPRWALTIAPLQWWQPVFNRQGQLGFREVTPDRTAAPLTAPAVQPLTEQELAIWFLERAYLAPTQARA